jgi:hypothetical protein
LSLSTRGHEAKLNFVKTISNLTDIGMNFILPKVSPGLGKPFGTVTVEPLEPIEVPGIGAKGEWVAR